MLVKRLRPRHIELIAKSDYKTDELELGGGDTNNSRAETTLPQARHFVTHNQTSKSSFTNRHSNRNQHLLRLVIFILGAIVRQRRVPGRGETAHVNAATLAQ